MADRPALLWGVFAVANVLGVLAGLFGVGGGAMLVPVLVLVFGFEQHHAQGTTLFALVPPTGLLAFFNYWRAGEVNWKAGLLLVPGVFLGGLLGSKWAHKLSPQRLRRVFAVLLLVLGAWQALSSWVL